MQKYPLSQPGIFRTIQGEGWLMGLPSIFIRLAGCSLGCRQCDTNYQVGSRLSTEDIVEQVSTLAPFSERSISHIWITGGEPTDHNLFPLISLLHDRLPWLPVVVATNGEKLFQTPTYPRTLVSVSPHNSPEQLLIKQGEQLNLVPGLNNLNLDDWKDFDPSLFSYKYATPMEGNNESLRQCIKWINDNPGWRLGSQSHKSWGVA